MKTRLNINSTPGEILGALTDYIPFLTNITEILNDLHSLGLSKDCIKRVLSGGSACVFGDIASPKFSNRKVIVSSAWYHWLK